MYFCNINRSLLPGLCLYQRRTRLQAFPAERDFQSLARRESAPENSRPAPEEFGEPPPAIMIYILTGPFLVETGIGLLALERLDKWSTCKRFGFLSSGIPSSSQLLGHSTMGPWSRLSHPALILLLERIGTMIVV
ncbi:hypothetical protein BDW71DRAFT_57571 [Aspergillus fruticulosus]